MPKLYFDLTPFCAAGHAMIRLDRIWGPHTATAWTCTRTDCENYLLHLVVPMVPVEAVVVGKAPHPAQCEACGHWPHHRQPSCPHKDENSEVVCPCLGDGR